MNLKAYFVTAAVVMAFALGTQFAFGQAYPAPGQQLVITETKSFSRPAFIKKTIAKQEFLAQQSDDEPMPITEDDPNDKVTYTYMASDLKTEALNQVEILPRSEGDYTVQVVRVKWRTPSGQVFAATVTDDQIRAIIYNNNGASVKDYWKEVSNGLLRITSRVDSQGRAIDIFDADITLPTDNCNTRLLNEAPPLIDEDLPVGNKIADRHATIFVFPDGIYQQGMCTVFAQANVSQVRSMSRGNKIWMPQQDLLFDMYYPAHELGHTLGLGHSSSIANNGSPDPLTWPRLEYGDPACLMGSGLKRLNTSQADKLGWYMANASYKELQPGTYNIVPPTEERGFIGKKTFGFRNGYITVRNIDGSPNGYRIYPEIRQKRAFDNIAQVTNYWKYYVGVTFRINLADVTAAANNSTIINFFGFDSADGPLVDENVVHTVWNIDLVFLSRYTPMLGAKFKYSYRQ